MRMCDDGHKEIVYECPKCPLCEAEKYIEQIEKENDELRILEKAFREACKYISDISGDCPLEVELGDYEELGCENCGYKWNDSTECWEKLFLKGATDG